MSSQANIGDRILGVVRAHPDCTLEDVTTQLLDLHWSDIFMEVNRLNRSGHLRLQSDLSKFTTSLHLP